MNNARRTGATSLATLATCGVAFVAIHAIAPQWAQSAGLDFWQMPEAHAVQKSENERGLRIEAHADDLCQRIAASDTVANAVVDNQLGWESAVDRIIQINRGRDGFSIALQAQHDPVTDDRELHACYLRDKIIDKLKNDPTRQCDVMARISAR